MNAHPGGAVHPDAELLALCAQLADMQVEWQRLWSLTPDGGEPATAADRMLEAYADQVWPLLRHGLLAPAERGRDVPARLLELHATTPEGLSAKAAAVLAIDEAAAYFGTARDDGCDLYHSLLRDAAGAAYRPLGEDAPSTG